MGADFLERAAPTFRKSWDRARITLGTADLFTRNPECKARTAIADVLGDVRLDVGERVIVDLQGDTLMARRGNRGVARFANPAGDLLRAVRESCGIADGRIERIHRLSGVVEISLC